jgi:hypothetical protein
VSRWACWCERGLTTRQSWCGGWVGTWPRAVLGPIDISARLHLNRQLGRRDLMTLAVPWRLFQEMEAHVDESLLATKRRQELWRRRVIAERGRQD